MNRPAKRHRQSAAAGVFACVILVQGIGHAEPQGNPVGTNDNAVLKESIRREATRQDRVSTGIEDLHSELRGFIEDMETNKIYEEVEGRTLSTAAGKLDSTNNDFVRNAAGSLRNAADQPEARSDRLAMAGSDIKGAIGELTELMMLTKAFMGNGQLDDEVKQIIRSLVDAIERSTELRLEMTGGKRPDARRFDGLAAEQDMIAVRIENLRGMIRQSANDAITAAEKETFTRAEYVMSEKPADRSMRNAGKDIRESDIASAIGEQKQALEWMQELAKALKNPEDSALAEAVGQISSGQADGTLTSSAGSQPGDGESGAGEAGAGETGAGEAGAGEAGAGEAGAGEAGAGEAGAGETGAGEAGAGEAGAGETGAGEAGAGETGAGETGAGEAGAGEAGAGEAGAGAGEAAAGGAGPDGPVPDGPPSGGPGSGGPGSGGPGGPGPPRPGLGPPGSDPGSGTGTGFTGIASKNVYGAAPENGQTTWRSLDDADRAGLGENFARELPREYRDMLKAYYEQLSK